MRRVTVALAVVGSIVISVAIACHGDVAHPDIPPLPPASGTPVGYLVDSAADLKLSTTQVASLKDIDSNLAGQLDIIDMRLKAAGQPHVAGSGSSPRQPGGFRMAGGRHRGTTMRQQGSGSGSGSGAPRSAAAVQLEHERENDIRDAIRRALALLDATQRKAATDILMDRGLDLLLPAGEGPAGSDEDPASGP